MQEEVAAALLNATTVGRGRPSSSQVLKLEDLTGVSLPAAAADPSSDTPGERAVSKSGLQTHDHFQNYLTDEEWKFLKSKVEQRSLLPAELGTVIYRAAARCGLHRIREPHYADLVGIFGLLGGAAPTTGEVGLQTVNKLKNLFASMRRGFPDVPVVLVYPPGFRRTQRIYRSLGSA